MRGWDLNPRPSGYEPDELPDCSTPRQGQRTDVRCQMREDRQGGSPERCGPGPCRPLRVQGVVRRSEDRRQMSGGRAEVGPAALDAQPMTSAAGHSTSAPRVQSRGGGCKPGSSRRPRPVHRLENSHLGRAALAVCPLSSVLCLLALALLVRPGDDPLSHPSKGSTLGAVRFHGRVRNGVGWGPHAMVTRSKQKRGRTEIRGRRSEIRPARVRLDLRDPDGSRWTRRPPGFQSSAGS